MAVTSAMNWKFAKKAFIIRKIIVQMRQRLRQCISENMGKRNFSRHTTDYKKKYDFRKTQEMLAQDMYEGLKILEEN